MHPDTHPLSDGVPPTEPCYYGGNTRTESSLGSPWSAKAQRGYERLHFSPDVWLFPGEAVSEAARAESLDEPRTSVVETICDKNKAIYLHECAKISNSLSDKVQACINQADWSALETMEREAAQLRAQREPKKKPARDAVLGLGDNIDWDDRRVQQYLPNVSRTVRRISQLIH